MVLNVYWIPDAHVHSPAGQMLHF